MEKTVVSALYYFVRLENYQDFKKPLLDLMANNNVKGTLLLAKEGINGTIAGSRKGINTIIDWLKSDPRLTQLESKESICDENPFYRSKVKLKKEIVTMGVDNIDPNLKVGRYVKPKDWNRLIEDPEVLLIDTRNDYEVNIGTFKGAINPETTTFRQFPKYAEQNLNPKKHKKIAMFCTGGIRCEKSTAYLREQGFEQVYHLQGGILKYLEDIPENESLWQGECFVFDNRVAVNHQLEKGSYDQCHACRHPITDIDKDSEYYIPGVSCPNCYDQLSENQKSNFAEREKQIQLAKQRGEKHIGTQAREVIQQRKKLKHEYKNSQKRKNA